MTAKDHSDIRRKLRILNHTKETGNISKTCLYYGISREIFYKWKRSLEAHGESSLINSKARIPKQISIFCFIWIK